MYVIGYYVGDLNPVRGCRTDKLETVQAGQLKPLYKAASPLFKLLMLGFEIRLILIPLWRGARQVVNDDGQRIALLK